ncbi:MAG: aldehyde dehydrogenase (NADP(+)) [Verrucomicrobiales bacterium]|nr:aldehyde dehydrogenase (NADP(+)) [Verrucomicrobiales bacterium]
MQKEDVLIAGEWRAASGSDTFQAANPATKETLAPLYPVSSWADCDAALECASEAFEVMSKMSGDQIAKFLGAYADLIEANSTKLVEIANQETGLPASPRLGDVELPRTTGQLRQAADAARNGTWKQPTIDSANGIRSCLGPLGPVCVFGPNNFPFAFNSAAGGDFAAAIAAGNPVIAKANTSHPGTTKALAELAAEAAVATGMPTGTVQLIYRTSHEDGAKLVSDPRIGATGYTGSRHAGLTLKKAADEAGKPIYLELSSVNPVVILPGSIKENGIEATASEFSGSCLMGTGQFCTNPGLVVLIQDENTDELISTIGQQFENAPDGVLLSSGVEKSLSESHKILQEAGAEVVSGTGEGKNDGFSCRNTLLKASGAEFIASPEALQTEAFGNCSLIVVAKDLDEATGVLSSLEGNLTGCIYSAKDGSDDAAYDHLEPVLRRKVGRLLNDKMPTGVAVSPAMNHGGPFPATGHPGFTAVGIPASIVRFGALHCYDNVRQDRLPDILKDSYSGPAQRFIDGKWS